MGNPEGRIVVQENTGKDNVERQYYLYMESRIGSEIGRDKKNWSSFPFGRCGMIRACP